MNVTMVLLRLVHLFSAVLWVGATFSMVLFISPTARAVGPDANKFMQHFSLRSGLQRWLSAAGGLTVLSGAWMYYILFGPLAPLNVGTGLAVTIGAVAGIAALFVGVQVGRTSKQIGELGEQIGAGGGPPTQEQMAQMGQLQERMGTLSATTAILMVVALAGMTLSEYFVL